MGTLCSCAAVADKPLLRVGIVSDNQAYAYRNDWGMNNMVQALDMLAGKNIDLLLMVGDISDSGDPAVFDMHMQIMKEKFGSAMPQMVSCAGNHDFWVAGDFADRDHQKIYDAFCKGLKQSNVNPYHAVIKGYHFIALSEDIEFGKDEFSRKMVDALEKEIQQAVAADPEKPVFVLTHYPPKNTVSGSHKASGQTILGEMFKKYPQVVSLSGHTHYPLEDERSIWQQEYTALSTSTLAYGCMEEAPENACNGILPFGREVTQMMYMEIFPDRLVIRRYNVTDKREIKPDQPWVVPMPFDKAKAPYTLEARAAKRKAPEFPAGTEAYFRYDFGFFYIIFNAAQHDDFVHFYRIKITDTAKNEVVFNKRYVGDFYRLERNRDSRMVFRLPGELLEAGTNYRYEIYPEESFGKEGTPLVVEARVPDRCRFRKEYKRYPQE